MQIDDKLAVQDTSMLTVSQQAMHQPNKSADAFAIECAGLGCLFHESSTSSTAAATASASLLSA